MSPAPEPPTDPSFWGAIATGLASLGASTVAIFKTRDINERIHRANGKAQEAINRVAVNEAMVKGISERLDRIEDKLDRVIEGRH